MQNNDQTDSIMSLKYIEELDAQLCLNFLCLAVDISQVLENNDSKLNTPDPQSTSLYQTEGQFYWPIQSVPLGPMAKTMFLKPSGMDMLYAAVLEVEFGGASTQTYNIAQPTNIAVAGRQLRGRFVVYDSEARKVATERQKRVPRILKADLLMCNSCSLKYGVCQCPYTGAAQQKKTVIKRKKFIGF